MFNAIQKIFQRRWIPIHFRILAVLLGGLHTWAAANSHSMNADGISYLDIGDAYVRGDWAAAINAVWSPMYSWTLGLVMHLVNPSMHWEFPLVHFVNFAIYLFALLCFEFFWRQLTHYRQAKMVGVSSDMAVTLPEWAWLALGYVLFIWSSLSLIEIWAVTPDMLMAALVYLAAGLILRIRFGFSNWRTFILLGVVLGLGYLAKTVMFPLAFIFLGVSLFSVSNIRRSIPHSLVALLVFLLISAPFIAAISYAKGTLTFGEAGKLTYARYVNNVPYPHWQGETPGNGTPKHPSRKIFDAPPIYEFGAPIGGTYPICYDPSYWYEGVISHFDLKQQIRQLTASALFYFDLFCHQQGGLVVGVFILYLMSRWKSLRVTEIIQHWGLVIPSLAAFGMYAIVYVEGRYLAVFCVLLWADLLANLNLPDSQASRRLVSLLSVTMILFMLMNIAAFNLEGMVNLTSSKSTTHFTNPQAGPPSWPGEIAEELHRLGVQPGDKVAVIGYAFDSFWARLARVKIVSEMLDQDAEAFWWGNPSLRAEVLQAFASTGAKAIVAEYVPNYASMVNWHRVGNSNFYIYLLG